MRSTVPQPALYPSAFVRRVRSEVGGWHRPVETNWADLRLFLTTFAGGFLFVSIFIG